jgi:hypothetical protein
MVRRGAEEEVPLLLPSSNARKAAPFPSVSVKGTPEEILASVEREVRARKRGFFTKAGVLSGDDAMWVALSLLRGHVQLARAVASRFDEILIDEAQDTSELQLACIAELKKAGTLRSLVLIGDLEQSIFSFQGASAAGCRALAEDHDLDQLTLNENHRCSQKICNAAAHFCAREKPDIAVGETSECEIDPELVLYPPHDPEQAVHLFRSRLDEHQIAVEDAAVLARRHTMVEALAGSVVKVEIQERPERVARIAVALAAGTLTRTDMRYAERTVARCAFGDVVEIEDLDHAERFGHGLAIRRASRMWLGTGTERVHARCIDQRPGQPLRGGPSETAAKLLYRCCNGTTNARGGTPICREKGPGGPIPYQLSYVGVEPRILAAVALSGERVDTRPEPERRQLYELIRHYPAQR